MAAATATVTADPPGYFVGPPLHYQEQQAQAVPPAPLAAAATPAVDDQNALNAQIPGYYKGRVQPRPSDGSEHNNNNADAAAAAAAPQKREPGFLAKLFFGCFSGSSGNPK